MGSIDHGINVWVLHIHLMQSCKDHMFTLQGNLCSLFARNDVRTEDQLQALPQIETLWLRPRMIYSSDAKSASSDADDI